MTKKYLFLLPLLLMLFMAGSAVGEVKLPGLFSDNMVLQQQSDVLIWGWAKPGNSVKVSGSWNNKSYTAKADAEGYWSVRLATPQAGFTPYTLSVKESNTVTLKNVLIGEVWLCSGQSNMEMPVKGFRNQPVEGSAEAIAGSRNANIRMFTVKRVSQLHPDTECVGSWLEASPATTGEFSATAYFFGKMLYENIQVPVGLIHSSWGGSRIEAWMTPESLTDIPEKKIPQKQEDIILNNGTPTVLYNGMIRPIQGYGIRGAIWYQGEANRDEYTLYPKMFENLVKGWRAIWGVGEFPFYYCQIAPFNYLNAPESQYIREAQAKGMKIVPNTGMAVLMDSQSPLCIHPPKKKEAGERLALWALSETYGMKGISYKSPEVKKVDINGRMVTITFDCPDDPGMTAYGKEIKNFKVAGKNKNFRPGVASVLGNRVFIFSPEVDEPVAVRYCFDNTSASEIFTIASNLPLSSFRTDDW